MNSSSERERDNLDAERAGWSWTWCSPSANRGDRGGGAGPARSSRRSTAGLVLDVAGDLGSAG